MINKKISQKFKCTQPQIQNWAKNYSYSSPLWCAAWILKSHCTNICVIFCLHVYVTAQEFTHSFYGTPSHPHSPGLVVLCRLPLLRNGDLGLGFPCPSLLLEEEEEEEDDILLPVLLLLLEQSVSELCSGQQREGGAQALMLELCLTVGQRGSRTHTGPGEAPLQSWLLLPAHGRSAGILHSDKLKGSPRLPRLLLGAILLGCLSNQGMSFLYPMQGKTAIEEGIADQSVELAWQPASLESEYSPPAERQGEWRTKVFSTHLKIATRYTGYHEEVIST